MFEKLLEFFLLSLNREYSVSLVRMGDIDVIFTATSNWVRNDIQTWSLLLGDLRTIYL